MEEPEQHIKVEKKELFIIASLMLGVLILMVLTSLRDARTRQKSQAQTPVEIGVQALSPLSEVELSEESVSVDLRSNTENGTHVLYDATATGEAAVWEFMDKNPVIDVSTLSNDTQVQGVTTDGSKQRVLPANFRQNSTLSRTLTDKKRKDRIEVKRYYYNQKIKNIPVYAAVVRFDLVDNDKVVGVDGDYVTSETTTPITLSDQDAITNALTKANEEIKKVSPSISVTVCQNDTPTRKIFNEKIAGISQDETNTVVLEVIVCDTASPEGTVFKHSYFVSLDTGAVVSDYNMILEALNRIVYGCKGGSCSTVARSEGQGPGSDSLVNKSYDYLGEVYNLFFSLFGRDSFDNRGAALKARVHANVPNAQWDGVYMSANDRFVAKDIWAHELTHAVTSYTSGLGRGPQQGALNESISDIFGYGVDSANWTMGETSGAGSIRDLSNPPRYRQPDRMFSSLPLLSCTNPDPHINAGVTNKAFYLMVQGGSHNGCTVNSIGREKALAVIYKTNTEYLRPSSGFFDFNNKVNQACGDLYGASSAECANVKAALQATELDQDRCGAGKSRSTPICAGGTQPTVGQTQPTPATQPTSDPRFTPAPTAGQGGSNTNPTAPPTAPTVSQTAGPSLQFNPSNLSGQIGETVSADLVLNALSEQIQAVDALMNYDTDMLEVVDIIDGSYMSILKKDVPKPGTIYVAGVLADPTKPVTGSGVLAKVVFKIKANGQSKVSFVCSPGGITNDSNIARNDGSATDIIQCSSNVPATITAGKGVTLALELHFQGVDRAFGRSGGSIPTQVGISGDTLQEPIYQLVQLRANSAGVVSGIVEFPTVTAGNYCVSIKGPLHSRRKVCHKNPLEAQTGEYRRGNSTIPLTNGVNELDFTGISMMSGDIDQNGVVNSFDLFSVRNSIGSTNPAEIDRCDVNFDGACNGTDYGLVVGAILIKTDE